MAERAKPLFTTTDPDEFIREHRTLLALHEHGLGVNELCGRYDCTYPTIRKWLALPAGTLPKRLAKKVAA